MISSCCKSDSESTEIPTFYKWTFTIRYNERIFHNTSAAWVENFAQCNEDVSCTEDFQGIRFFFYNCEIQKLSQVFT